MVPSFQPVRLGETVTLRTSAYDSSAAFAHTNTMTLLDRWLSKTIAPTVPLYVFGWLNANGTFEYTMYHETYAAMTKAQPGARSLSRFLHLYPQLPALNPQYYQYIAKR